jgi:hypothetical protein
VEAELRELKPDLAVLLELRRRAAEEVEEDGR